MSREKRKRIAEETIQICNSGQYIAPSGNGVSIKDALNSINNSKLFITIPNIEISSVYSEYNIEVVNKDTLLATQELIENGKDCNPLILNFASAKNPGGGFLKGAQAQEETLARASNLYFRLKDYQSQFYHFNKSLRTCLYSDRMIYTPDLVFFRNSNDELLEVPYTASVITSPAVNASAVKAHERSQINTTMQRRIDMVLSIAQVMGYEYLVLGAWGCGVFRNNPKTIAELFKEQLESEKHKNKFKRVIFAIPPGKNYEVFKKVLT